MKGTRREGERVKRVCERERVCVCACVREQIHTRTLYKIAVQYTRHWISLRAAVVISPDIDVKTPVVGRAGGRKRASETARRQYVLDKPTKIRICSRALFVRPAFNKPPALSSGGEGKHADKSELKGGLQRVN